MWEDKDKEKVADICEKFEAYCNPRKNITYERHMFNTRVQKEREIIDAYVTNLKQKAASGEFENLQAWLVRDRIICWIKSDALRKRILREENLI